MSRVWGYVNSLELPVWLRPIGLRIYARFFGCDLEEIDPQDLTQYASLGEFFYRKLKDGARPIAEAVLVRYTLSSSCSSLPSSAASCRSVRPTVVCSTLA